MSSTRVVRVSETWEIQLPDDVSEQLEELPEERVNEVISDAVRQVLGMAESAEERREALRERMELGGQDVEELDDSLSEAEQKQAELRDKILGGD